MGLAKQQNIVHFRGEVCYEVASLPSHPPLEGCSPSRSYNQTKPNQVHLGWVNMLEEEAGLPGLRDTGHTDISLMFDD